jgi:ribonuclease P protein component
MQTFKKQERLCRHAIIDHLFISGKSLRIYPFVVSWDECPLKDTVPAQIMFTVSKRKIRSAVKRNRIRRLLRDAYRINKSPFLDFLNRQQRQCALVIIYTGPEKLLWKEANDKIVLILQRLQKEYEKASG